MFISCIVMTSSTGALVCLLLCGVDAKLLLPRFFGGIPHRLFGVRGLSQSGWTETSNEDLRADKKSSCVSLNYESPNSLPVKEIKWGKYSPRQELKQATQSENRHAKVKPIDCQNMTMKNDSIKLLVVPRNASLKMEIICGAPPEAPIARPTLDGTHEWSEKSMLLGKNATDGPVETKPTTFPHSSRKFTITHEPESLKEMASDSQVTNAYSAVDIQGKRTLYWGKVPVVSQKNLCGGFFDQCLANQGDSTNEKRFDEMNRKHRLVHRHKKWKRFSNNLPSPINKRRSVKAPLSPGRKTPIKLVVGEFEELSEKDSLLTTYSVDQFKTSVPLSPCRWHVPRAKLTEAQFSKLPCTGNPKSAVGSSDEEGACFGSESKEKMSHVATFKSKKSRNKQTEHDDPYDSMFVQFKLHPYPTIPHISTEEDLKNPLTCRMRRSRFRHGKGECIDGFHNEQSNNMQTENRQPRKRQREVLCSELINGVDRYTSAPWAIESNDTQHEDVSPTLKLPPRGCEIPPRSDFDNKCALPWDLNKLNPLSLKEEVRVSLLHKGNQHLTKERNSAAGEKMCPSAGKRIDLSSKRRQPIKRGLARTQQNSHNFIQNAFENRDENSSKIVCRLPPKRMNSGSGITQEVRRRLYGSSGNALRLSSPEEKHGFPKARRQEMRDLNQHHRIRYKHESGKTEMNHVIPTFKLNTSRSVKKTHMGNGHGETVRRDQEQSPLREFKNRTRKEQLIQKKNNYFSLNTCKSELHSLIEMTKNDSSKGRNKPVHEDFVNKQNKAQPSFWAFGYCTNKNKVGAQSRARANGPVRKFLEDSLSHLQNRGQNNITPCYLSNTIRETTEKETSHESTRSESESADNKYHGIKRGKRIHSNYFRQALVNQQSGKNKTQETKKLGVIHHHSHPARDQSLGLQHEMPWQHKQHINDSACPTADRTYARTQSKYAEKYCPQNMSSVSINARYEYPEKTQRDAFRTAYKKKPFKNIVKKRNVKAYLDSSDSDWTKKFKKEKMLKPKTQLEWQMSNKQFKDYGQWTHTKQNHFMKRQNKFASKNHYRCVDPVTLEENKTSLTPDAWPEKMSHIQRKSLPYSSRKYTSDILSCSTMGSSNSSLRFSMQSSSFTEGFDDFPEKTLIDKLSFIKPTVDNDETAEGTDNSLENKEDSFEIIKRLHFGKTSISSRSSIISGISLSRTTLQSGQSKNAEQLKDRLVLLKCFSSISNESSCADELSYLHSNVYLAQILTDTSSRSTNRSFIDKDINSDQSIIQASSSQDLPGERACDIDTIGLNKSNSSPTSHYSCSPIEFCPGHNPDNRCKSSANARLELSPTINNHEKSKQSYRANVSLSYDSHYNKQTSNFSRNDWAEMVGGLLYADKSAGNSDGKVVQMFRNKKPDTTNQNIENLLCDAILGNPSMSSETTDEDVIRASCVTLPATSASSRLSVTSKDKSFISEACNSKSESLLNTHKQPGEKANNQRSVHFSKLTQYDKEKDQPKIEDSSKLGQGDADHDNSTLKQENKQQVYVTSEKGVPFMDLKNEQISYLELVPTNMKSKGLRLSKLKPKLISLAQLNNQYVPETFVGISSATPESYDMVSTFPETNSILTSTVKISSNESRTIGSSFILSTEPVSGGKHTKCLSCQDKSKQTGSFPKIPKTAKNCRVGCVEPIQSPKHVQQLAVPENWPTREDSQENELNNAVPVGLYSSAKTFDSPDNPVKHKKYKETHISNFDKQRKKEMSCSKADKQISCDLVGENTVCSVSLPIKRQFSKLMLSPLRDRRLRCRSKSPTASWSYMKHFANCFLNPKIPVKNFTKCRHSRFMALALKKQMLKSKKAQGHGSQLFSFNLEDNIKQNKMCACTIKTIDSTMFKCPDKSKKWNEDGQGRPRAKKNFFEEPIGLQLQSEMRPEKYNGLSVKEWDIAEKHGTASWRRGGGEHGCQLCIPQAQNVCSPFESEPLPTHIKTSHKSTDESVMNKQKGFPSQHNKSETSVNNDTFSVEDPEELNYTKARNLKVKREPARFHCHVKPVTEVTTGYKSSKFIRHIHDQRSSRIHFQQTSKMDQETPNTKIKKCAFKLEKEICKEDSSSQSSIHFSDNVTSLSLSNDRSIMISLPKATHDCIQIGRFNAENILIAPDLKSPLTMPGEQTNNMSTCGRRDVISKIPIRKASHISNCRLPQRTTRYGAKLSAACSDLRNEKNIDNFQDFTPNRTSPSAAPLRDGIQSTWKNVKKHVKEANDTGGKMTSTSRGRRQNASYIRSKIPLPVRHSKTFSKHEQIATDEFFLSCDEQQAQNDVPIRKFQPAEIKYCMRTPQAVRVEQCNEVSKNCQRLGFGNQIRKVAFNETPILHSPHSSYSCSVHGTTPPHPGIVTSMVKHSALERIQSECAVNAKRYESKFTYDLTDKDMLKRNDHNKCRLAVSFLENEQEKQAPEMETPGAIQVKKARAQPPILRTRLRAISRSQRHRASMNKVGLPGPSVTNEFVSLAKAKNADMASILRGDSLKTANRDVYVGISDEYGPSSLFGREVHGTINALNKESLERRSSNASRCQKRIQSSNYFTENNADSNWYKSHHEQFAHPQKTRKLSSMLPMKTPKNEKHISLSPSSFKLNKVKHHRYLVNGANRQKTQQLHRHLRIPAEQEETQPDRMALQYCGRNWLEPEQHRQQRQGCEELRTEGFQQIHKKQNKCTSKIPVYIKHRQQNQCKHGSATKRGWMEQLLDRNRMPQQTKHSDKDFATEQTYEDNITNIEDIEPLWLVETLHCMSKIKRLDSDTLTTLVSLEPDTTDDISASVIFDQQSPVRSTTNLKFNN